MEGNFISALLLTLGAGLATGIGGAVIMFVKRFSSKFLSASLGFSAGVMILISLVELFPEAQHALSGIYGEKLGLLYTLLAFFGGMGVIALIDNLVPSYENPHEVNELTIEVHNSAVGIGNGTIEEIKTQQAEKNMAESKKLMRLGLLSSIVIAVHNFPEGLATFVTAMDDPKLGISIAFAIALHNIPEGIAVAIPIYYATKKRLKAVWNATLSGLAEPLGGLLGYLLLSQLLSDSFMGIILASVAGIMVYISLDELLPTAESYGAHHVAIIGVITGMAFMGFGMLLF
ncbi:MAG: zinc transporter ZupT [Bacteroidales bacterium]|nr:zinc transporter ZupT [Bacteroidales bacterium]